MFAGAEYYCMNCWFTGGMFGSGDDVEVTTERRAIEKVSQDVFKVLSKHMWGSTAFQREGCKKCKTSDEYHPLHATEYENAKNEVARRIMKALRESIVDDQHHEN